MVLTKLVALYFSDNNNHQWMKFSSNLPVKSWSLVFDGDRVLMLCKFDLQWLMDVARRC
ncbi:hypothetical protein AHAS_Ahas07G0059400 [Arachis hypogaea]